MKDFEARLKARPIRRIMAMIHPNIGDAVMQSAAMRWLKKAYPEAELVVNTERPASDISSACPWVDRVVVRTSLKLSLVKAGQEAGPVDLYINFHTLSNGNRWAMMKGIPVRVGMECKSSRLLHKVIPTPALNVLEIPEAMKGLCRAVHAEPDTLEPEVTIPDSATMAARGLLHELGLEGQPFVTINPGASSPIKRWPLEKFFAIRDRLSQSGVATVFVGGPGEAKLLESHGVEGPSAAGRLPILASFALIRESRLLVTSDSGLMHAAGAVGTATVSLIGANWGRVEPWGTNHILLHADCPCPLRSMDTCTGVCLAGIEAEDVWAAIQGQLNQANPKADAACAASVSRPE